jgi:hypothetical protein
MIFINLLKQFGLFTSKFLLLWLFIIILLIPNRIWASNQVGISIGPSFGFTYDKNKHSKFVITDKDSKFIFTTGVDITLGLALTQISSDAPSIVYLWWSPGFIYVSKKIKTYIPYFEMGFTFLGTINIGGGYSYTMNLNGYDQDNPHLFFGIIIPAFNLIIGYLPFIEPYYRLTLGKRLGHEAGILLKGYFRWNIYD